MVIMVSSPDFPLNILEPLSIPLYDTIFPWFSQINSGLYFHYNPTRNIPFSLKIRNSLSSGYEWYLPHNFPVFPTFRHFFKGHYFMIIPFSFHSTPVIIPSIIYSHIFPTLSIFVPLKPLHFSHISPQGRDGRLHHDLILPPALGRGGSSGLCWCLRGARLLAEGELLISCCGWEQDWDRHMKQAHERMLNSCCL